MGRLIDADDFIKRFHYSETDTEAQKLMNMAVRKMIKEQPTAYDQSRVIEQLEYIKSLVPVNRLLDDIVNKKQKELGMLIAYEKAIEIVKGGGVDA